MFKVTTEVTPTLKRGSRIIIRVSRVRSPLRAGYAVPFALSGPRPVGRVPGPVITSSAAGVVFAYGGGAVLGAGRWALRVARYAGRHGVYAGLATTCAVCGGAGPGCCSVACTAGRAMRWARGRGTVGEGAHPHAAFCGSGVSPARDGLKKGGNGAPGRSRVRFGPWQRLMPVVSIGTRACTHALSLVFRATSSMSANSHNATFTLCRF